MYGLSMGATPPARADPDQLKSYAMTMMASALPGETGAQVRIGIVDELVALVPARGSARGRHGEVVAGPLRDELRLHLRDEQRCRPTRASSASARSRGSRHRRSARSRPRRSRRARRCRFVPLLSRARHVAVVPVPGHHRDREDDPDAVLRVPSRSRPSWPRSVQPAQPVGRPPGLSVPSRPRARPRSRRSWRPGRSRGTPSVRARQRPVRQVAEDLVAQAVRQARDPAGAVLRGRRTPRHVGGEGCWRRAGRELDGLAGMLLEHLGVDRWAAGPDQQPLRAAPRRRGRRRARRRRASGRRRAMDMAGKVPVCGSVRNSTKSGRQSKAFRRKVAACPRRTSESGQNLPPPQPVGEIPSLGEAVDAVLVRAGLVVAEVVVARRRELEGRGQRGRQPSAAHGLVRAVVAAPAAIGKARRCQAVDAVLVGRAFIVGVEVAAGGRQPEPIAQELVPAPHA